MDEFVRGERIFWRMSARPDYPGMPNPRYRHQGKTEEPTPTGAASEWIDYFGRCESRGGGKTRTCRCRSSRARLFMMETPQSSLTTNRAM